MHYLSHKHRKMSDNTANSVDPDHDIISNAVSSHNLHYKSSTEFKTSLISVLVNSVAPDQTFYYPIQWLICVLIFYSAHIQTCMGYGKISVFAFSNFSQIG